MKKRRTTRNGYFSLSGLFFTRITCNYKFAQRRSWRLASLPSGEVCCPSQSVARPRFSISSPRTPSPGRTLLKHGEVRCLSYGPVLFCELREGYLTFHSCSFFFKLGYRHLVNTRPHTSLIHCKHRKFESLVNPVRPEITESTHTLLRYSGCIKQFLKPSRMSRTRARKRSSEVHEQLKWQALTSSSQCDEVCLFLLWVEDNRIRLFASLYLADGVTHTHPTSTQLFGLVTYRTDTRFTLCTCHVPATAWRVEVTLRREKTDDGNSASLYTYSEVCSSKPPAMPGRSTDLSFSFPYKYRVLTSDPQGTPTQQQANSASWCYQTHAPTCLSCVTHPCLFSSISIRTAHPRWKRFLPYEALTCTTDQCNEGSREDEFVNPSLYIDSEVCFTTHPQLARVCRELLPLSATGCLHDKGDGPPGSFNRS